MIITQRGFQSNSKIITAGDEMLETLINMKNLNITASYDFALMGRCFLVGSLRLRGYSSGGIIKLRKRQKIL